MGKFTKATAGVASALAVAARRESAGAAPPGRCQAEGAVEAERLGAPLQRLLGRGA